MVKNPNDDISDALEVGLRSAQRDLVLKHISSFEQGDYLDVGCGWGGYCKWLLRLGARNIRAFEISAADVETARNDPSLSSVSFSVQSALNMNYSDSSFDYIFAWEVIEHIPRNSEQRMFDEVYRVLKPGGLFFFSTPNRCLRSYFFDPASPFGHRHYSHSMILELGVTAKFIPKELVVRGKLFTGLFILSMYVSKWILRSSNVLERPFWVKRMNQELQKDGWFDLMGVFQKP